MSPLTGVLREAWDMYKAHAAHFLLISLAFYLVEAILAAILGGFAGLAGAFLATILNVFFVFLLQAALVKAVQDVRDGRVDLDFRATVRAALPYVAPVAGASILAAIAIAIGFALIIVPGLILLTFWSLIVPCIVIGGTPALASFGQSWRTVRGYAWNVFGTYVVVFLILIVFQLVLTAILIALPTAARGFISDIIAGTLIAPFIALVVTLVYYRLNAAHGGPGAGGYADPGHAGAGAYPGTGYPGTGYPPPGYPPPGQPPYPPTEPPTAPPAEPPGYVPPSGPPPYPPTEPPAGPAGGPGGYVPPAGPADEPTIPPAEPTIPPAEPPTAPYTEAPPTPPTGMPTAPPMEPPAMEPPAGEPPRSEPPRTEPPRPDPPPPAAPPEG